MGKLYPEDLTTITEYVYDDRQSVLYSCCTENDELYLAFIAESNHKLKYDRILFIPVDEQTLEKFEQNKISLRKLIDITKLGTIFETRYFWNTSEYGATKELSVIGIADDELPAEDCFLDDYISQFEES